MSGGKSIRIYLADDHQIVIDGLKMLLANEHDMVLCGSANDGDVAFSEIKTLKPDVALIDFRMPGKDGLALVRSLSHHEPVHFIVLSMHASKRVVKDVMNYGARGYLLKNTGREELLKAIRMVSDGQIYISPSVRDVKEEEPSIFTPREKEILQHITGGLTSQEISDQLSLSLYTVETHRKNILRKAGVKNLAGLIRFALEEHRKSDDQDL
jgi:DNA-binding NarL/FixJ family response regulator